MSTNGLRRDFFMLRGIRTITKDDTPLNRGTKTAFVSAQDNTSQPVRLLARREVHLVHVMRDVALTADNDIVGVADAFWLRACLRARNGDIHRALSLALNFLEWRRSIRYHDAISVNVSPAVRELLYSGVFNVAGNVSRDGHPVLTIRYRFYDPQRYATADGAITFAILVEYMLREYPAAQSHGMVVMEEMDGVTPANIDLRLVRFLTRAFSGSFPLRISAMYFVKPNRAVRTGLRFLSPFLAKKYKASIYVIEKREGNALLRFFEPHHIPTFMNNGGTLEWSEEDQERVARSIIARCTSWPRASNFRDAQ